MKHHLLTTLAVLVLAAPLSAQITTISGSKGPNVSAPSTTKNVPTMPAIACSAVQSLTAGRVVFPCVNVLGYFGVFITDPSTGAPYSPTADPLLTGASTFKRTSAGTTEDEHEIKATAGILYSVIVTNTNAAARYFRCANNTAAGTTPGTTTPIIDLAIPGNTAGGGFVITYPQGAAFSVGLTCWFVTGAADTDVAEVAANEIKAHYSFK